MIQTAAERLAPPHCVLVLEDDPSSRELMKYQLKFLGYDSDAFASAEEGYEQWQTKHHKIVITDCNLPGMSGFDLAAAIRTAEHGIDSPTTVIGITGYGLDDVAEDYRLSGMDFCLVKPVLLSDLTEIFPQRDAGGAAEVSDGRALSSDRIALSKLIGDDREKCMGLFSALVKSLQEGISVLDDAYANRSAHSLRNAAHRLRSSALAVGANQLAGLCREAETFGRDENWQQLSVSYPVLQDAITALMQDVKDLFCVDWTKASSSRICPLAAGSYQPFRTYCGQCRFRSEASA